MTTQGLARWLGAPGLMNHQVLFKGATTVQRLDFSAPVCELEGERS